MDVEHLSQRSFTPPRSSSSEWEGFSLDTGPRAFPLNTHAEAFFNEILRLSEQYRQRCNKIRIQIAAWIEAQQQGSMIDEQHLMALLWADRQIRLRQLLSRYDQGLPPETVEAALGSGVITGFDLDPANVNLPAIPPVFEVSIQGQSGNAEASRSFEAIAISQPPPQSIPGDASYGTMTVTASCTCAVDWWLHKLPKAWLRDLRSTLQQHLEQATATPLR